VLRRLESLAEVTGPWPVLDQAKHTTGSCRTNESGLPSPAPTTGTRWTNGSGLPTGCVTPPDGNATARGIPVIIQSFCITPILAFFNSFLGLSRHLSRLDKPKKLLTDNEGSG
jgi:hypothetical protein